MCEDAFHKFSSEIAFSCTGTKITFKQLDEMSSSFAGYLDLIGVKPGEKVALMMPNLLQYPVAVFGCFKAGVVAVPLDAGATGSEIKD